MTDKLDAPISSSTDASSGARESGSGAAGPKAIIKNVDMSEEMQQESVDIASAALEKYNIEKDIAAQIKKEFDRRHGSTWHVVVGKNFGSFVTHGEFVSSDFVRRCSSQSRLTQYVQCLQSHEYKHLFLQKRNISSTSMSAPSRSSFGSHSFFYFFLFFLDDAVVYSDPVYMQM
jgi:dynein light chain LC8-type